jgi:uncharacterized membrane protein
MDEGRKPSTPLELGSERLEAFSDAVMAVIITILALELRPPAGADFHDLTDELPNLLIYVLSFVFIAIYWNNHHHLLRATTRINGAVMWANMFLLFWLSLIPVVTEWLQGAQGAQSVYKERIPAASYGVVALAAGVSYTLLVRAIIRANGRDSAVGTAIASDVKGWLSLVIYSLGVAAALAMQWLAAYALYAAVAVVWFVPDRRFTRSDDAAEGSDRPTSDHRSREETADER